MEREAERRGPRALAAASIGILLGVGLPGGVGWAQPADNYATSFRLESCTFSAEGRNPYFSLHPGDRLVLEATEAGELVHVEITVLPRTETIAFVTDGGAPLTVTTRVVEEREEVGGELREVSRNFFARCTETNSVYYFGEDVDIYEGGVIVSHDGAWRAGQGGARPGLIMPGELLVGSRYFQEQAPDVAMDRGENVAAGLVVEVPAGRFEGCVEVLETTPLDPAAESRKTYCPGVGLVIDDEARLIARQVAPGTLVISPPTGTYTTTQGFDVVLMLSGITQPITGGRATLDGADVTAALAGCVIPGALPPDGATLRCPGVTGTLLGAGPHRFSVTVDLADGGGLSGTVIWTVVGNSEGRD